MKSLTRSMKRSTILTSLRVHSRRSRVPLRENHLAEWVELFAGATAEAANLAAEYTTRVRELQDG